jgi:hypothetical protein
MVENINFWECTTPMTIGSAAEATLRGAIMDASKYRADTPNRIFNFSFMICLSEKVRWFKKMESV